MDGVFSGWSEHGMCEMWTERSDIFASGGIIQSAIEQTGPEISLSIPSIPYIHPDPIPIDDASRDFQRLLREFGRFGDAPKKRKKDPKPLPPEDTETIEV